MTRTGLFLSIILSTTALTSSATIAASQAEQECVMTQMMPLSTRSGELGSAYADLVQKSMSFDLDAATRKSACEESLAIRAKGDAIKASVRAVKACKDEFQISKNVDIVLKGVKDLVSDYCGPGVK
jgi:hypothetical protein